MTLAHLLTPVCSGFPISEMGKMTYLTAVMRIKWVTIGCAYSRDWHTNISYYYSCQRLLSICIWKGEKMKRNQLNCGISSDHQLSYNGQSNHWVLFGKSDCPPGTFITKACPLLDYKLFPGERHWIYAPPHLGPGVWIVWAQARVQLECEAKLWNRAESTCFFLILENNWNNRRRINLKIKVPVSCAPSR